MGKRETRLAEDKQWVSPLEFLTVLFALGRGKKTAFVTHPMDFLIAGSALARAELVIIVPVLAHQRICGAYGNSVDPAPARQGSREGCSTGP